MNRRRILFIAGVVLLGALCVQPAATPENPSFGRCTVNIPSDWGNFRGVSQGYGFVFEDQAGTLRVVNQMPCGLEGTPNVTLEIHRK